ncbi:MAG: arsenate reductase family protein [Actinomycetota bacterium]
MSERNLIKEPLSVAEIKAMGNRVGGVVELVGPTKRREVEGMSDSQIIAWLREDPKRFRRPLIDLGDDVLLGFNAAVRTELESRA